MGLFNGSNKVAVNNVVHEHHRDDSSSRYIMASEELKIDYSITENKHFCDDIIDHEQWESIEEYTKSDLAVKKHLGKGRFSDVFEVSVIVNEPTVPIMQAKQQTFSKLTALIGKDHGDEDEGLDTSIGVHSLPPARPSFKKQQKTYAMKCLRPPIRSNPEIFIIGVEDLVRETVMLASLDHPNIINLHGRAGGSMCTSNLFPQKNGYFILLDRLTDTLEDRINHWKRSSWDKKAKPSLIQVKTACSIADALSYLHSKNIVFRDLKPANVGFDSKGVLKIFDFGFACKTESYQVHDVCGTPRYMAPEVGLKLGHGTPADVYSFGLILWEMCALKKPFENIKTIDEINDKVIKNEHRPKLKKNWPQVLKGIMEDCWSSTPSNRPTMKYVKSNLLAEVHELSSSRQKRSNGKSSLRNSLRRYRGFTF